VDAKHYLNARLMQLLREEEIKWYQRSKANKLLQGDSNTRYFHLVANGKRRKSHIFQLEDGDRIIKGEEPLKSYITDYYKIYLVLLIVACSPLMKIIEMT
jgi:hypothetical protein